MRFDLVHSPGAWGLTSFDAKCLSVELYLRLANKVETVSFSSVSNKYCCTNIVSNKNVDLPVQVNDAGHIYQGSHAIFSFLQSALQLEKRSTVEVSADSATYELLLNQLFVATEFLSLLHSDDQHNVYAQEANFVLRYMLRSNKVKRLEIAAYDLGITDEYSAMLFQSKALKTLSLKCETGHYLFGSSVSYVDVMLAACVAVLFSSNKKAAQLIYDYYPTLLINTKNILQQADYTASVVSAEEEHLDSARAAKIFALLKNNRIPVSQINATKGTVPDNIDGDTFSEESLSAVITDYAVAATDKVMFPSTEAEQTVVLATEDNERPSLQRKMQDNFVMPCLAGMAAYFLLVKGLRK